MIVKSWNKSSKKLVNLGTIHAGKRQVLWRRRSSALETTLNPPSTQLRPSHRPSSLRIRRRVVHRLSWCGPATYCGCTQCQTQRLVRAPLRRTPWRPHWHRTPHRPPRLDHPSTCRRFDCGRSVLTNPLSTAGPRRFAIRAPRPPRGLSSSARRAAPLTECIPALC